MRRFLLAACLATAGAAEERSRWNLPGRTWGGTQFWGDLAWVDGWRIQQHAWTGHCRLLDPRDVRRAWGGEAACRAELARRTPAPAVATRVVVLLHGLGRSRRAMADLGRELAAAGDTVALVSWPTTRDGMDEHARRLRALLAGLRAERVAFVTHSLGALAVRHALAAPDGERARWPRVDGVVMLFPPNQGARAADLALRLAPVRALLGEGLRAAATANAAAVPPLTDPGVVVAGARGDGRGWNPLLRGDDDLVVRLDETALPGVPRTVVHALHTFGMDDPAVRAAVHAALAGFATVSPTR